MRKAMPMKRQGNAELIQLRTPAWFLVQISEESEYLMSSDHERLHELVVERERHESHQQEDSAPGTADAEQTAPRSLSHSSPKTDSEQAQTNLERMLETGEENPIS